MATGISIGTVEGIYPTTTIISVTSGSGSQSIITGIAGQTIRVYRMALCSTSGTAAVTVKCSGTSGATSLSGVISLAVNTNIVLPYDGTPWFVCNAGENLVLSLAASSGIGGVVLASQG